MFIIDGKSRTPPARPPILFPLFPRPFVAPIAFFRFRAVPGCIDEFSKLPDRHLIFPKIKIIHARLVDGLFLLTAVPESVSHLKAPALYEDKFHPRHGVRELPAPLP